MIIRKTATTQAARRHEPGVYTGVIQSPGWSMGAEYSQPWEADYEF